MWYIFIFIAILILDQVSKIIIAAYSGAVGVSGGTSKHITWVVDNFLEITYSENSNGAMGLFRKLPHSDVWFIVSTVLILGGIVAYLIVSKKRTRWLNTTLALVTSGAVGNFIDRLTTGYVRDFIHVIIPIGKNNDFFPYIFNVADIALVVGAIMLVFYLLFLDKDALLKPKSTVATPKNDDNK